MKRRSKSASSTPPPETALGPGALDTIRAEKVARARKLVASSDYPSKEITQAVANLLADHAEQLLDRSPEKRSKSDSKTLSKRS